MRFQLLIHWGRVPHICVCKLTNIGSNNGLSPGHYLNQCWDIVNSNLSNTFQWNLKQNSYIFIKENAFENVVCDMAAILTRPQCVMRLLEYWITIFALYLQNKHLIYISRFSLPEGSQQMKVRCYMICKIINKYMMSLRNPFCCVSYHF